MKNKPDVLDNFVKFKAQVENESGMKIKILKFDDNAESTSCKFQRFLKQSGIIINQPCLTHHYRMVLWKKEQNYFENV